MKKAVNIHFDFSGLNDGAEGFSEPAIILFDAYDGRVHDNFKAIKAYGYLEYGEIWFDGHYVSTSARNMKVTVNEDDKNEGFDIMAERFEDHLSICMRSGGHTVEVIAALPDNSKGAYIGLTGENCIMDNITVQPAKEKLKIKKIVSEISYIDRLESDLPNIQIDRNRSGSTKGIPVKDRLRIDFHAMSLPGASLVWHCPYIALFYSEDGKMYGKGYRSYAMIKINGEGSGNNEYAQNRFTMKKSDDFMGWENWKKKNKEGIECTVYLVKSGNKITLGTENLGIAIENTTLINDDVKEVYVALTGDRVALTDIRVKA